MRVREEEWVGVLDVGGHAEGGVGGDGVAVVVAHGEWGHTGEALGDAVGETESFFFGGFGD